MTENTPDPDAAKQQNICAAASQMFAQYGFRRTSMEDIARAAGMSRPALYQHFRNKEDIFHTLVTYYYDSCAKALDQALSQSGTVSEKLQRAFAAIHGPMVQTLLDSPHGEELLSAPSMQNSDVKDAGEARFAKKLGAWLWAEAEMGRVTLDAPPEDTARMMMKAMKGIKEPPYATFAQNRDRLAALLARGISTTG